MKILLVLGIAGMLSGQATPPAAKVQIVDEVSQSLPFGLSSGSGHANITDVSGTSGFDYTYKNCHRFETSVGSDTYKARFESIHDITLLTVKVGTDDMYPCRLKVTLKSYRYGKVNGELTTLPLISHLGEGHAELSGSK